MILPFFPFISETEGIFSVGGKFETPKSCMQEICKNMCQFGSFELGTIYIIFGYQILP